jgi:large subunit ribosomal protein L30
MSDKKIKVKLTRSLIGATERQKKVVKALGLSKMNQVVEHDDSAIINGMVNKISHMVSVEK